MSAADLLAAIGDATAVRVARVGASEPLSVLSDPVALRQLREALVVDPDSLTQEIALMTPGVIELHFLRGHDLRASVTYLPLAFVRWTGWPFDARLRDPERLATWLTDRGWLAKEEVAR